MATPSSPDRRPVSQNVADTLERISDLNPTLNAFISVFENEAMEQARVLDEELRQGRSRGPLHGRTISIKDLIDVKGVPTTCRFASASRAHRRCRRAGGGPSSRCRRGDYRQDEPS
jgi:Asp-tRNA(Asn)/Glu-tRNA(Gln) amidotransferase A subunit family amidase